MLVPNYMQTLGPGARLRRRRARVARSSRTARRDAGGPISTRSRALCRTAHARSSCICTPNNPTGARLTADELDAIAAIAGTHGCWVLSDEIYRGAELDGVDSPSMWGRGDRVIVTSGLSKAYGLPGLRIGWVVPRPTSFVASTVGVPRLHDDCPRRAERSAGAHRARSPRRRTRLLARTRGIIRENLPSIEAWLRESRRRVLLDPSGGRRHRLRALQLPDQLDGAGDAAARRGERADRAGRSIRHGRLPPAGLRRAAGVPAGRARAPARAARRRCPHSAARTACMTATPDADARRGRLRQRRAGGSCACSTRSAARLRLHLALVAIAITHHGSVIDPAGIDARARARRRRTSRFARSARRRPRERSGIDLLRRSADRAARPTMRRRARRGRRDDRRSTSLAASRPTSHVRAVARRAGAHVVTANKGPAAFAYDELEALADSVDRVFFFEERGHGRRAGVQSGRATTMPALACQGFRGVINTTCSYILTAAWSGACASPRRSPRCRRGHRRGRPLARHRRLGCGGQDGGAGQRADRRAHHAARRGADGHPRRCRRGEVADAHGARPAHPARRVGRRERGRSTVEARVEPELLDRGDPLAGARRPRERPVPAHRSARRGRHRPARRARSRRPRTRCSATSSRISRRLRELLVSRQRGVDSPTMTCSPIDRHRHRAVTQRDQLVVGRSSSSTMRTLKRMPSA